MTTTREMRDRLGLSSAEWREAARREREREQAEREAPGERETHAA